MSPEKEPPKLFYTASANAVPEEVKYVPEIKYDIEKMADLKKSGAATQEITFDNAGHMVVNNRKYRRNGKQLWRAVSEGQKSIRHYTRKSNKSNRASKKRERQNRRAGRR